MWNQIAEKISEVTGQPFQINQQKSVGGGCINRGTALSDGDRTYFVKFNSASQVEMFEAEYLGLQQMYNTHTIRVPQPLCCGVVDSSSYIVMEWLEFGRGDSNVWAAMGHQLAQLHRYQGAAQFGWDRQNTIGSTPQMNPWTNDWSEFFAEHRIGYQLQLAKRRGGSYPSTDKVVARVKEILRDRQPQPS
ncbi:MAG: fructosamine kinase family protein, partial [Kamptonema sp. SIO4C4]|nr:fructosamine kinase family protein [Kamptonema sp. SIO4C4]